MIKVYGCSDDLIEIEGDIREEFSGSPTDEVPAHLGASDGTVLRVWYDAEGNWRIRRVVTGAATYAHLTAEDQIDVDAPCYSDLATLDDPAGGGIRWVVLGDLAKAVAANA